jgi:hypothetical protein
VNDVWLAVIAVAVAVMAAIQIFVVMVAMRTARHVGDVLTTVQKDLQPIVTNLKSMSADAARTASIASAQAQRAEQLVADLTDRVTDTVSAVEDAVRRPAREAYAMLQGLFAAVSAFREGPAPAAQRHAASEEEDSLFIG